MSKRRLVTFFSRFFLTPHACFILMSCKTSAQGPAWLGPSNAPSLAGGIGRWVESHGRTTRHKKMQTHHAGFLLLCVCVMLIFTDIHLLSVPHAGPLTRTHNLGLLLRTCAAHEQRTSQDLRRAAPAAHSERSALRLRLVQPLRRAQPWTNNTTC